MSKQMQAKFNASGESEIKFYVADERGLKF